MVSSRLKEVFYGLTAVSIGLSGCTNPVPGPEVDQTPKSKTSRVETPYSINVYRTGIMQVPNLREYEITQPTRGIIKLRGYNIDPGLREIIERYGCRVKIVGFTNNVGFYTMYLEQHNECGLQLKTTPAE